MNKEKNYWPEAIALIILAVVGLVIWTVMTAVNNPVDKEVKFLMDYRSVDENYNEIQKAQKAFKDSYHLEYLTKKFDLGPNIVRFSILDNKTNEPKSLDVELYLSKPFGNEKPIPLGKAIFNQKEYQSKEFDIQKEGRYRVIYKIAHNQNSVFFEQDINATKK